jgi:hypothetical protein
MRVQVISFNKFFVKTVFSLALLTGFIAAAPAAYASKAGEIADNSRVISLKPEQLPALKGGRISSFSLAAVSGGRMNPIPYQFDERTESGYIHMSSLNKKLQKDDPLLGTEGFFDENDELLFMLKDAGPRRKNGMATDGKAISEIEIYSSSGERRYVYVVQDARLESDTYYVRYSSELGRVETDYYALKVNPKNAFMWEEFYYDNFDGAHPRQPVDTIKIWMKSNALGGVPITVHNKHMVAKVIAEKSGPIRSTTEYKLTLTYFKTPLLAMKLQIVHHEQEISYDSQLEIPKVRRRLIAKPVLRLSMDGYDLQGSTIRYKGGPSEPGIVDGEISEVEKRMRDTAIDYKDDNWVWLDSNYGFMLFSNFKLITDEEAPMKVFYVDDLEGKDKSEFYKGNLPNAGFEITKIPLKGMFRVIVDLKMFSEDLDTGVDKFVELINAEPRVKVFNL